MLPTTPSSAPLAAAAALAGCRGRVLLHSARDDDGLGRWSFVAAEPVEVLAHVGGDPFDEIEAFLARHGAVLGAQFDPEAPCPRVIGYVGYDPRTLWLAAYGAVARFDRGHGPTIVGPDPARRAWLADRLARPATPGVAPRFAPLVADDDGAAHVARVRAIQARLVAGDVYQVNLARRLVGRCLVDGDPLALYAALAEVAPAPYGALIEADGATVISGSPERFLAAVGDRVETRPIKGTLARGDGALADTLARSDKDAAEHLMIVDLERNDLGRIAELGSVVVDQLGYVIELPALFHKVSRVSARPRPGVGYAELLRATFPGGSITGAPKIAAMAVIAELEPVSRGPYCGALGYFGDGGAFELAIAIRIGVVADDELHVHVGGGIVADSDPIAELAETETKATGWREAIRSRS